MMKIEDCRIGNLVRFDDGFLSVDCLIKRIGESGTYDLKSEYEEGIQSDSKYINPILITEELLKKYSFYLTDEFNGYREYEYSGSGFFLNLNIKESKIDSICLLGDYVNYTVELKYFHQLQNLYYALTGFDIVKI